jgi:hypothetical protein
MRCAIPTIVADQAETQAGTQPGTAAILVTEPFAEPSVEIKTGDAA